MKLGPREKILAYSVLASLPVVGLTIGLVVYLVAQSSSGGVTHTTSTSSTPPTTTSTTTSPPYHGYDSVYKQYRFAAVTTDTNICSQIGVLENCLFFSLKI